MSQPTRATATPRPERRYDTSQLTEGNRGSYVHRDYAAHFFRWGWAKRFVKAGARVLDVGCGSEEPLARVISQTLSNVPKYYLGVDYGKISRPDGHAWAESLAEFDFSERWREIKFELNDEELFDVVVSFESIEHMPVDAGAKTLAGCRALLAPGGIFLISTPVFNGKAAAAHIHEYTAPELQEAIESAGFRVVRRHGTFASYHDIKKVLKPAELESLEALREFYDGDVAACFFAPMYPDASRNCAWVCEGA